MASKPLKPSSPARLASRVSARVRRLFGTRRESLGLQRDALAMQQLARLLPPYLPWTGSAMRPSAVLAIVNDIALNGRRDCVECGCGISTVAMGTMLARLGGHLVSIEHDAEWAAGVADQLRREGLDGTVTLVHAPLIEIAVDGTPYHWYDPDAFGRSLPATIDLLVVDGPPSFTPQTSDARFPALPFFSDRLADECTVVLDDIHRPAERRIAKEWESRSSIRFEYRRDNGQIAIGRRGPGFTV